MGVVQASVVKDTRDFDIHRLWDSMKERLLTMYTYAIQTLCIPHTSCDVERSFSMWKNVRSEKQYSMQRGLHKAYVSFGFNGFVNARQNRITNGSGVPDVVYCMQCVGKA